MDEITAYVSRTAKGLRHLNTIVPSLVRLRLYTPFGKPIPQARFRLTIDGRVLTGRADGDGWVEARVMFVPETCLLEWDDAEPVEYYVANSAPPAPPSEDDDVSGAIDPGGCVGDSSDPPADAKDADAFQYVQEVYLHLETDDDEAAYRRLHNLGLTLGESLASHVREFEAAYDKPLTGELAQVKDTIWNWHDKGSLEACAPPDPPDLA